LVDLITDASKVGSVPNCTTWADNQVHRVFRFGHLWTVWDDDLLAPPLYLNKTVFTGTNVENLTITKIQLLLNSIITTLKAALISRLIQLEPISTLALIVH
jgi:hypothetical protein